MSENIKCPVGTTIELIGGKYKTLIMWHLVDQVLRFNQLQKLIPNATAKMLTQQLRELEADGLIERVVYPVVPPKVEYSLTSLGNSMIPILDLMYQWGKEHMLNNGEQPNCNMRPHGESCAE